MAKDIKALQKSISRCDQRIHGYENKIEDIRICKYWVNKFPMDCFRINEKYYGFYSSTKLDDPFYEVEWHRRNDYGCFCFDEATKTISSSDGNYFLHIGSIEHFKIIEAHKDEILKIYDDEVRYYENLIKRNGKNMIRYEMQLNPPEESQILVKK